MGPILILTSAVAAATSPVTLEEARSLPPVALGEKLLTGPHRPIVEVGTYPEGGPPPPPNAPISSAIRLWEAAHASTIPGFCEKVRYRVTLAPVRPGADGKLPAAAPASIEASTTYRWNPGKGEAACEGPSHVFFELRKPAQAERVFAAIRLLGQARDAAQDGRTLGFGGAMVVQLTRDIASLDIPGIREANPVASIPMPVWRAALARYPLDRILNFYWPGQPDPPLTGPQYIAFNAMGFGGWMEASLRIEDGRSVRLDLKRYIPPPF